MRSVLPALVLLLALGAPAFAQAPTPLPLAATSTDVRPSQVQVQGQLSSAEPSFGEAVELTVTLRYPAGYKVFFPQNPSLKPLKLLKERASTTRAEGADGTTIETLVLPLLAPRTGLVRTPPVEVPWVAPDGQTGTALLPSQRLVVKSRLSLEAAPEPAAPPAPRPLLERNWPFFIGIIVLVSTVLAAALTWLGIRWWQRRAATRAARPRPPAHEVAYAKLAQLAAEGLIERGEFVALAVRLNEIAREYFGLRFSFDGLDMTGTECLAALEGKPLRGLHLREIDDLLVTTDLVKFARRPTTIDEMQALVAEVRRMVDATRRTPDEEEAERAAARAANAGLTMREEAASLGLRLQALSIDLAIAGALVAMLAWIAVELRSPALWTASLCIPFAWLLLRDLPAPGSPGKALANLELRGVERYRVPLLGRLLRNLPLAFPVAGAVAEALVLAYLPDRRRMGDRLARSRVLLRPGAGAASAVAILVALALAAAFGVAVPWLVLGGRPLP
jgi:hypothetical protein